ncbi:putative membrane protein [Natronocella acetinitrilica]|uniref:Membrane protein n=1 Tax=Natronocella acetinitrilica TaxID=414046 RepID=A0AAE3G8D7_9GAMM|nr:NnrU family protein [Natronocella acetinitrilica]MCP1676913.1 putative membrane protein [Natronocella acetinitrilica]
MLVMILGLVIFLGAHSVRIVADDWRGAQIARFGEGGWKAIYAAVSILGLIIAIYGYGMTRIDAVFVWFPPRGLYHLTALLMIPAFILLAAAYVPRNHIKAKLGHPMVLAVKVWALSHLLVNGRLGDIIFFGAFLVWAVLLFRVSRRRPAPDVAPTAVGTVTTVVVGLVAYLVFAFYLHRIVAGVSVMG